MHAWRRLVGAGWLLAFLTSVVLVSVVAGSAGAIARRSVGLVVVSMSGPPAQAVRGSSFTVIGTVRNAGPGRSKPVQTVLFLSSGSLLRSSSVRVGGRHVGALRRGARSRGSARATIPA